MVFLYDWGSVVNIHIGRYNLYDLGLYEQYRSVEPLPVDHSQYHTLMATARYQGRERKCYKVL